MTNTFISAAWDKIKHAFDVVQAAVVKFAGPGLHIIASQGGDILTSAAAKAVAAAEIPGASNGAKFEAAKNAVLHEVKDQIPNLTTNAINLAIELAVAALKSV